MKSWESITQTWEVAGLPVMVFRPDQDTRPIYQNPAADRLCHAGGLLLNEMLPQEAQELTALACGDVQTGVPLFCHLDSCVYTAVLLPWADCTVCLLQDVTAYHHNNQRALDEAIMASRAKTSFLSEMSHDIRTPMGAIIGLTEITLSQQGLPPKARECLEKIKVASGHMMSLLNEVLDMSRIESGRITLQEEETNVADLLHEILVVAKPQADAGKLSFHLNMGAIEQERILADSVRLKQICLNLLSNAIKYTPAGGQVDLSFSVTPEPSTDHVCMNIQVSDNGIGMSKEFLSKLFVPFEREQRSTVNKIQGTGLGMAITKSLVELMNGEIQVASIPNQGSRFTVRIPFQAVCNAQDDRLAGLAGQRILLLDGDGARAASTRQMLHSLRMRVDLAGTAESAVQFINDAALSGEEYFALLSAENIPGIDILRFLTEVRKRMGARLPILVLSESDWNQTEYMFTCAGADSFIPLPLFRSRLAASLYTFTPQGRANTGQETSGQGVHSFPGKRLLLVEDNELNREIAQELLGSSCILIETAEDGAQAVERFLRSAPGYYDIILMDIQMPVMNGLEATRKIRQLHREDARRVPIIAMTANAFAEDVKNSLDAGMDAHISKPLDMDRVFSVIEHFLREGRP